MHRFKIDHTDYARFPFALFYRERFLIVFARWRRVETFQTRGEAIELYEKIKGLPEYLD